MGTEADIIAAPFTHGLLPLPLIFGSATKAHKYSDERNQGKQPKSPHGCHPPPEWIRDVCGQL
jgi:hypothetical protein